MASSLSNHTGSKPPEPVYQSVLTHLPQELAERLNVEQMFVLIDGVLPLEACLYYQVLPLFIEGSRLNLGMVSPEDSAASDYVRRIISYHNYSLITRSISSEALQAALTAYLNYAGSKKSGEENMSSRNRFRRSPRTRSEQGEDPALQQTLVVDSPEELGGDVLGSATAKTQLPQITEIPAKDNGKPAAPIVTPLSESETNGGEAGMQTSSPPEGITAAPLPTSAEYDPSVPTPPNPYVSAEETLIFSDEASPSSVAPAPVEPVAPSAPDLHSTTIQPTPPHFPKSTLLPLELEVKHLSSSIDVLASLPPKELLQELLGRILFGGIGRLYFERQAQYGRVLWSQNGVLQSVLDRVELPLFQGLINELKRMTHLSLIPVQKARQVEMERLYQQTRLLLRFRFMPNTHGEEATIQVLRGAALKFYQQQQLTNLERDALTIAKQLQNKVTELKERARSEGLIAGAKLEGLPALSELLHTIEVQLGTLQNEEDQEVSE